MLSLARRRPDDSPHDPQPETLAPDRYTVLLLDETQLDRLLHRKGARAVGSAVTPSLASHGHADRLRAWRSPRVWAGAATAVLLTVGVGWVAWPRSAAPGGSLTDPRAAVLAAAPVVATGASFSVDLGAFPADDPARIVADRLAAGGWPAYTWRLDERERHVLVGPYATLDEAQRVQGGLSLAGRRAMPVHVDERLRVTPAAFGVTRPKALYPPVQLVAAPGRLSFVFELVEEPRTVSGERLDASTFEIEAGPLKMPVEAQSWKAPGDVSLVTGLSVGAGTDGTSTLKASLRLPESAHASVRVHGRRVYVDVARRVDITPAEASSNQWAVRQELTPLSFAANANSAQRVQGAQGAPSAATAPRAPDVSPVSDASVVPVSSAAGGSTWVASSAPVGGNAAPGDRAAADAYRATVQPALKRFEEIQSVLRTAVGAATPEVLSALAGTCAEVERALGAVAPPPVARSVHALFVSAALQAKASTSPTFTGDRVAAVREAGIQFDAAKARLQDLGR